MTEKTVKTDSIEQTAILFGGLDKNVRVIESAFDVNISTKDSEDIGGSLILIVGEDSKKVDEAAETISNLRKIASLNGTLKDSDVDYVISMVKDGKGSELRDIDGDCICITNRGKPIKAKTVGQKRYVDLIRNNTVVMGVGPAGTGKTFLAVAMAVKALRAKQVSRIILTRPAVEAGEKLGFLPGDMQDKVDPYLRPLYDALFDMFGAENFAKHMEKGTIEVAPLAYMRGRTLDEAFIILDEAQNTTPEQIKMFLTRLGNDSRMVITGDITQIDLPDPKKSGLVEAVRVLKGIDDIAIHRFTEKDVVRHKLVQDIIRAYEKYNEGRTKNHG